MSKKEIIGRETWVEIIGDAKKIPAKIDTGADSSAIWASGIFVDDDHKLHFKLFDQTSEFFTGKEHIAKDFKVSKVRSASGEITIKFNVKLSIRLGERRIKTTFGLSDRSTHHYPVLIGRRTLAGKFIVDVTQDVGYMKPKITRELNKELKKNPKKFYTKFFRGEKK